MKKKVLLYGVSTYKNKGVEAIINSTLNQIDLKENSVTIASHDINYNSTKYNEKVKNIIHYNKDNLSEEDKELELKYQNMPFDYNNFELLYQKDVVEEIKKSDICISVGGDNYCYDHCTWLYALDNKSSELGKKTVLWGASLFENINDLELIENLKKFDVLVIRESLSLNAVKKYIPEENIIYAPDPAFSLKIKKVKLDSWYKNRKYIILNASPLTIKTDEAYKALLALIDHILKDTKYSVCLLPHVITEDCDDREILLKLKKTFNKENRVYFEENDYDCTELKYIISNSELAVVARTHASIAAYSTLVPTLVLGYSVKSKGIAKDLFGTHKKYVLNSKEMNTKNLIEHFDYINDNKENIKKILEDKIPDIKEQAASIFTKMLEKIEEQKNRNICQKRNCTGCGLCASLCPTNAISMKEDKEGFIYPVIDLNKCINCNKCRMNCHILKNENNEEYKQKIYALKNKNINERMSSTSGGAFSILAKKVFEKKGIVYGCEMKEYKAIHVRVDNYKDLDKIRGSKYIQSETTNIFKQVKEDLNNKKLVLFSGTPCQIGALKEFIGNNERLITVSVVCHGIMNTKLLEKHINSLELENNTTITNWKFRTKEHNDWTKSAVSYKVGETLNTVEFTKDDLMYLYLKNVILRESCYNCKYKGNNKADFILGDYWGIEVTNPNFADKKGVSALIINSEKGEKFAGKENLKKYATITDGNYEEFVKYNPSYISSEKKPLLRNTALLQIDDIPFNILSNIIRGEYVKIEYNNIQKEMNNLRLENIELVNKLNNIYNSKRWKAIDKPLNVINKIIGKNQEGR